MLDSAPELLTGMYQTAIWVVLAFQSLTMVGMQLNVLTPNYVCEFKNDCRGINRAAYFTSHMYSY
jgi:hypothetical protein